jgi:putative nucleotide binding protein
LSRRGLEARKETGREPAMYVLDYLETGNPSDRHFEHRNQPLVQGVGVKYLSLLEAIPLPAVRVEIFERIDLGPHSKVKHIIHVSYDDLTSVARSNLPEALKRVVTENEKLYTEFFNIAEPINIRLHALELLPGVGKKTMKTILEERESKRFENFADIKERVKIDPVKALVERIIKEMVGGEKYYLFVRPRERTAGEVYLGYLERLHGELL